MNTSTAHSQDAQHLKERLRSQLRWLRARLMGHAAVMLLGSVGLLLGAAILSEPAWSRLGPAGAILVLSILGLAALWIVVFEVIEPLRRIANLKGFSRELERHGDYNNMLEAATQFTSPKRKDPLAWGASPDLVAEILRRARHEAERTSLAPRVPLAGVSFHLLLAAFTLLVWLGIGLGSPDRVSRGFASLVHPERLSNAEPRDGVYTLTGDLRVPVGESATLTARDLIGGDVEVFLQINRSGDFWQELPTDILPSAEDPAPFLDVAAVLDEVEDPFRYRFRKGSVFTREFQVSVRERPVLKELSARLEPPAYTRRPARDRDDLGGTISVLEGTRVSLRGRASTELSKATRIEPDEAPVELELDGDSFTDAITISQDMSFRVGLVDAEGLANDAVTVYRFVARPDDPPTVQLSEPGTDLTLDRDLRANLAGLAADDVGLARLDLLYRNSEDVEWSKETLYTDGVSVTPDTQIQNLTLDVGENEVAVGFVWDLSDLELFPGDTVLYCLEATDNNGLVGGRSARSSVYRLRLPTIAEVFGIERMEREEQGDELADLLDEGEELEDTLERLNRELKKNPNPDWAKQQEIRDAMERQQALRERLEESSNELQQNLENFERNNAGSMELLQKMETIQELMENLQDESLQAYMEAMEEAMDQIQPHELQRAMEEALENQEDHNRRLDRTIELLQQLERERTMSDLVEEVAEYLKRQEELEEQTTGEAESEREAEASDQEPGDEQAEGEPEDQDSEGEQSEGERSEGEQEGEPSEGEESEGEQSEGEESEGEQSEGEESEGEESEGEQSEGEQSEGEQSEGEQSEGEQSEGEQSEGEQSEGEQQPEMTDEELAEAQERLAEEAKALEERIREVLEELKKKQEAGEASDPSAKEMAKALEEALEQMSQQGKASDSMKAAQEQLKEGDRDSAKKDQEEAQKRLVYLYEVLSEGQQSMSMATAKFATEKLQQTAYDLLNLSFSEEKVIGSLQDGAQGQRLTPITREQGRIQRNTARISEDLEELARKNFMISEQLLSSMRDLVELLERSVEELQLSRSRRSRNTATSTMGEMNRIVMSLLTMAMNSGGQGGGGGGEKSTSEQMQELSQDQSRLNSMTQELRRKMQNGLSAEERQELAQLRARQEAIRQQLQEIRQQIEDERRVLGDLGELGDDIDEVVDDLEGGRLDANLERRQEKILSRMLDAQRSIREREFAKRRESREGENLYSPQEGAPLVSGRTDHEQQLRRWLAPERAPHAYQDDVRRYFRQIQGELDEGTENE